MSRAFFFFLSPSPKLAGLKGIFGKRCEAPLDDPEPSRNTRATTKVVALKKTSQERGESRRERDCDTESRPGNTEPFPAHSRQAPRGPSPGGSAAARARLGSALLLLSSPRRSRSPSPARRRLEGGGKSPSSLTRKSALFPQKPQLLRAENTSGRPSDTHRCAFVNPHTRRGGRRMASEGKSAGPRRMAGGCSLPKAALLLRPPFVSGPCLIPRSGSKSRESWRRPK